MCSGLSLRIIKDDLCFGFLVPFEEAARFLNFLWGLLVLFQTFLELLQVVEKLLDVLDVFFLGVEAVLFTVCDQLLVSWL